MTDIESVEIARADVCDDYDPQATAHAIMRVASGLVADQRKAEKADALECYQDVMDSVDAHLNLLDFQHAVQTRDATEIGRLILKCHDKDNRQEDESDY